MRSLSSVMDKGKILLSREKRDFEAGFCLIREQFSALTDNLSFLHPSERVYYNKLAVDRRKFSYLIGRKSAKEAISTLVELTDFDSIAIDFGIFQFPVVKGSFRQNIQVSISHCDDIAVALAFPEEHPLGIDIESFGDNKCEVVKSQVCAKELELIANCHLSVSIGSMFIWTIKEALSKVFKTGLTIDFRMMEISSLEQTGCWYTSNFFHFTQYKAISMYTGNYVCSIVLPRKTTPAPESFFTSFVKLTPKQE